MDRDLERDGDRLVRPVGPSLTRAPHDRARQPEPSRVRAMVREQNRVWCLSEHERATLWEIGRFRTVAAQDLVTHHYSGHADRMNDELRSLLAQGLVRQRTASIGKRAGTLKVLVLSKAAKLLLEEVAVDRAQNIYAGFVKPSEVAHDAAIYRMFQAEARRIAGQGGSVRRVILDYELKRLIYTPLAKAKRVSEEEYAKRQTLVAQAHGLKVIDRQIVLPDLRIEYVTRDGERAHVDLELATEHYHASHLAAKARAGFRFYCADGSADRLTRVLEEREITASIFSL